MFHIVGIIWRPIWSMTLYLYFKTKECSIRSTSSWKLLYEKSPKNSLRVVQMLPPLYRCFATTLKAVFHFGNDSSSTFMLTYSFWRCGRLDCFMWDSVTEILMLALNPCMLIYGNYWWAKWHVTLIIDSKQTQSLLCYLLMKKKKKRKRELCRKNSFREHLGQPNWQKMLFWNCFE